MSNLRMLDSSDAVLLVVDVQDVLLKAIHESDRVVWNTTKLIEAAKIFSIPVLVTLQNVERFGGCTEDVADALPHDHTLNKMTFSCAGGPGFLEAMKQTSRKQVVICGIESHVCVNQTAHDLLSEGYCVHIVKDALSSRTRENWITSVEKMRDSGCIVTSTEMAIFELTKDATSPEFKKILPLVKETTPPQ